VVLGSTLAWGSTQKKKRNFHNLQTGSYRPSRRLRIAILVKIMKLDTPLRKKTFLRCYFEKKNPLPSMPNVMDLGILMGLMAFKFVVHSWCAPFLDESFVASLMILIVITDYQMYLCNLLAALCF
jgi:hypothetical protein